MPVDELVHELRDAAGELEGRHGAPKLSLSYSMTCRSAIAAGSTGTSSSTRSWGQGETAGGTARDVAGGHGYNKPFPRRRAGSTNCTIVEWITFVSVAW
jgi:hypothetical protein